MFRIPVLTGAVVAIAVIALSACSAGGDPYGGSRPSSGGNGGAPRAAASELTPPRDTILSANSTAQLGTVVIDGLGFTLYRSDGDSAKPPTSTCVDACARDWPPVLDKTGAEPVLEGVDPSVVGSVIRDDGSEQVTIGGWPVYRYAADSAPGSTDGHGKADAWWAVTPTGAKAREQ